MDVPKHIVAVSGLFRNPEGRILLVRTPARGWELPGGQVELGEDLTEALVRETLEESGCRVRVERLAAVYSNLRPPQKVIFLFTGAWEGGEPQGGHEVEEAGWFTPEEALAAVQHQANRQRLMDALDSAERPVYRVYRTRPFERLRAQPL